MAGFAEREAAWIAMNRVRTKIFHRIERALAEHGLPRLRWYDVLWELDQHPEGLRPFQVEELLLFDQSSFSRQVARMVGDGLITQSRSADDGRGKVLHLTDEGRRIRQQMWAIYGAMIDSEMEKALKAGELEDVCKACDAPKLTAPD